MKKKVIISILFSTLYLFSIEFNGLASELNINNYSRDDLAEFSMNVKVEYSNPEINNISDTDKHKFWKKNKWYAFGAFVVSVGAGSYFHIEGDKYYDEYKNADVLTSTTDEVEGLRKDAETMDKYRNISFSISVAPLCWFFYSWYKE